MALYKKVQSNKETKTKCILIITTAKNDKDGEGKRFTPLMIKKKNNGHENPPPHRIKKLELDKVLKVEILEIRVIAPLIFNFFFVLLSN